MMRPMRTPMSRRRRLVSLSPHEEITLYRIARGLADPATHRAQDVERLKRLELVERTRRGLRLTTSGHQRISRWATGGSAEGANGLLH